MDLSKKGLFRFSCLGVAILLASPVSYAAGYKLEFQSPSVLADGGDAAVVEDVGTNWYNSAGLVYLPQQLIYSFIGLYEPTTFSGSVSAPSAIPAPNGSNFFGIGSASSHNTVGLPAIHYGMPLKDRYAFGLTIAPAWGLLEEYGDNPVTRYDLVRIYSRTLDIAPSLAVKFDDHWSLGLGPDFHYFALQSKNHVRTEGNPLAGGTATDSISRITTNSWNYGMHIGILYRLDESTRFGLNYRSKITQQLEGESDFVLSGGPTFETNRFRLTIPMPPTTSFSLYHDLSPKWAIMGTVAFDQWSVVRQLNGRNYIQPPTAPNSPPVLTNIVIPQDLRNTFDVSLGTHYTYNEKVLFRASIKYEQTPTINKNRDLNFPDAEKLGLNFGLHYQATKKIGLDAIYAHVFNRTKPIEVVTPAHVAVNGHVRTSIDLAGLQLVWTL